LLREPCPRCGGLQVRYNGKIYCVNEDDIEAIIYGQETKEQPAPLKGPPAPERPETQLPQSSVEVERDSLRKLLRGKLDSVTKELETTSDVDKQSKLLDLISKYVEILSKLETDKQK